MINQEIEELKEANKTLRINMKYEVEVFKHRLLKILEKHEKDYSLIKECNNVEFYQVFVDNLIYDLKELYERK